MRFLIDENMARTLIAHLRNRGHEVLSIKETDCGEKDKILLDMAQDEDRILLTQDKDFGDLTFRDLVPAQSGIVLFRLSIVDPEVMISRMIMAIDSRMDWAGHFSVITDDRIRMRLLQ